MQQAFQKKIKTYATRGISLVEILVGTAVIVTAIVALLTTFTLFTKYSFDNQHNVQAALLLEEGIEGIKFMRDYGWTKYISPLNTGTTYYFVYNGSLWLATTTVQSYIDGEFLRTFAVDTVYRDGNNDIAVSGTQDNNTKKITVSITYRAGHATTTTSASTYISNLFAN